MNKQEMLANRDKRKQAKSRRVPLPTVQPRNQPCGECSACCHVVGVNDPNLKKSPFQDCPH